MYELEDNSKEQKKQHLRKFQKKRQVIYTVNAVLATALSFIYVYYTAMLSKDVFIDCHPHCIEYSADLRKTSTMQWIISAIFTLMIIFMSVSLMIKLRIRFYDFYVEYGCFLWVVFTIQALSMIVQTTIEVLLIYDDAIISFEKELHQS